MTLLTPLCQRRPALTNAFGRGHLVHSALWEKSWKNGGVSVLASHPYHPVTNRSLEAGL